MFWSQFVSFELFWTKINQKCWKLAKNRLHLYFNSNKIIMTEIMVPNSRLSRKPGFRYIFKKNPVFVWFWENSAFLWKIPVLLVEVRKKDFEMKIVFWPLISYKISLLKFYNLRAFCKILQIIAISILKQNDPKSQKSRDNTSLVWSTYDIFRIGEWSEVAF